MANCRDFSYLSSDGKTQIHAVEWAPQDGVRGIVQIAHGIAEYVKRYAHFAEFLCSNGFLVVGNDHLGHGESAETLGYWGDVGGWEMAVGDMRLLYQLTREKYPDVPCFLFGHSMGSFLSRTYIIRYPNDFSGVILCGTGQQPAALLAASRVLTAAEIRRHGCAYQSPMLNRLAFGGYNNGIKPSRTLSDWISRDSAVVDAYCADPLCGYIPSAGMFRDLTNGISFVSSRRNVQRMDKNLPVLFISGDKDPVGENGRGVVRAWRSFLDAGMRDLTIRLYPGARHELVNELNRDEVFADVLNWLEEKM
jgi:alpha-beta hydrolase superfamily lysophospholipase